MTTYDLSIYVISANIILLLGIFCFVYFCFICYYTRNPLSFALIWLVGSISCFTLSFIILYADKYNIVLPCWMFFLFITMVFIGAFIFGICELLILKRLFAFPKKEVDYIIILGAGLKKDKLTKSLKFRLDTAYDYLIKHEHTTAIVSGGMGSGEIITEAQAMGKYLREKGIASNRIIQEEHSTNTYENIFYSKTFLPSLDVSVGIVTNNFHIYRGEQIAKKQGFSNLHGISAPSDKLLFVHFMVREGFAVLKYKLTGKS